ncbi:histone H1 [Trichosporon asahii var. asahii CBS 8904]|uniref:Histone H1 n=2 Tax=Trichosporon asahii var. asahii TaxID=189963 RepID=K1VK37_TRIAC|nr:histone H1 [Trichosporon asahii var. asahii CBS 2479]EJT48070.1 histone H1 [Trichosporon asahii var. asahii CBS 2479]EKC99546.1 histone H1 [Trichosporon asahii var. asahii CBS 8904]
MAPVKKATGTTAKKASSHPTFLDMIQEAILAHPEDARSGVSRPTIKKFLATKYNIDLSSASNINNLSNAIKRGADKGVLLLPKGVSGKIKVAAKAKKAAGKENEAPKKEAKKPAAKKPAAKKAAPKKTATKATTKKATTTTKKTAATKAKAPAKKAATTKKTAAAKK